MAEPANSSKKQTKGTARKVALVSPDSRSVLDRMAVLEEQRRAIAAEMLDLAAQFVELNPVTDRSQFEGEFPVAGPGAPAVAEYSIAAVSAVLSMTNYAARGLLGDAVEIKHRLPKLWGLVQRGVVPVWKVRRIGQYTKELSLEAALWIDSELALIPRQVSLGRIEKLAAAALARFDPAAHAAAEAEAAETRGVWVKTRPTGTFFTPSTTTSIDITLDTPDADRLQATIAALAGVLGELGSTDSLDVRRAKAAGMLGDPQAAADLLAGMGLPTRATVDTTLVVHFEAHQLANNNEDGQPWIGIDEKLGPITTDLLAEIIKGTRVTIRPVINLADPEDQPALDRHDPTEQIRETVIMRNQVCVFPGCGRDSRSCDLDHVIPYTEPNHPNWRPGQTTPNNLAPLCRFHHRVKTHKGWTYKINKYGRADWTTPDGTKYQKPALVRRP
jgi:hypothetical protein